MKSRTLIVVSIALITAAVAVPSPVRAQAAGWILWEKNMIAKAGSEITTWEPQDGFESIAECRTSGQQLIESALAFMKSSGGKLLGDVRPDGRSAVFAVTNAGAQETIDIRFICFPGVFDPRPRAPLTSPVKP
jgi:hypothetical protein